MMLIAIAILAIVIGLTAYSQWDSLERLKGVLFAVGLVTAVGAVASFVLAERAQTLQAALDEAKQDEAETKRAENERLTAQANQSASVANEGLSKANLEIEGRKQENLQLSIKLEEERTARSSLEYTLKKRMVPFNETMQSILAFA